MVWAENILRGLLNKLVTRGSLEVELYNGTRWIFGDGSGQRVVVRVADKATAGELIRDPEVRFGELYMDGRLVMASGTILDFLRIVMSNAVRKAPPLPMRALEGPLLGRSREIFSGEVRVGHDGDFLSLPAGGTQITRTNRLAIFQ